jgi:gluconokinase
MRSSLSWFVRPCSQNKSALPTLFQGVSGTGKSTLGSALARALDVPYVEGDDLHPRSNIEKMSSGHPLTDSDREPWLKLIRTTAERMALEVQSGAKVNTGGNNLKRGVVISCSALKIRYRDVLRGGLGQQENDDVKLSTFENSQLLESPDSILLKTVFVYIEGTRDVLMDRMTKRTGHFMKPSMLDKQLEALESPDHEEGIIVVSLMDSTEDQVRVAQQGLKRVLNMGMEVSVNP